MGALVVDIDKTLRVQPGLVVPVAAVWLIAVIGSTPTVDQDVTYLCRSRSLAASGYTADMALAGAGA